MTWQTAARTHPGMRREHNEDAMLVRAEDGFWLVADGMGGHEAGDVASSMVIEAVGKVARNGSLSSFVDSVEDAVVDLNRQFRAHAEKHFGGRTMGCTVVMMAAEGSLGVCLWAGDSRLYRLRNGELLQVSRDHSPVEEMVDAGILTAEEAALQPDSSVITRAVGGQTELYLDVALVDLEPGDTFLLCSDGLYREVEVNEIAEQMANPEVQDVVDRLLDMALDRGARDNVTIIVVRPEVPA
jgi:serine/threonine protein phosphatase PrpC